jgi:protein TonB
MKPVWLIAGGISVALHAAVLTGAGVFSRQPAGAHAPTGAGALTVRVTLGAPDEAPSPVGARASRPAEPEAKARPTTPAPRPELDTVPAAPVEPTTARRPREETEPKDGEKKGGGVRSVSVSAEIDRRGEVPGSAAVPTAPLAAFVSAVDLDPEPLEPIDPRYPLAARQRGQEGEVLCRVTVGETGAVVEVSLVSSSGIQALDRAALKAVRRTPFAPGTVDGKPVTDSLVVSVVFRLE